MSDKMCAKKYFLKMVAACINGQPIPVCPDDVDVADIIKLSQHNTVQGIMYQAIKSGSIKVSENVKKTVERVYISHVMRDASQTEEISFIRNKFSESKIKYMFLKGTHLKNLYSSPEIRFMVDMDILVHKDDVNLGKKIFLDRNYSQEMNNGKDIVFIKQPFLTIELHQMLFVDGYFMHDYFLDVWKRAEKVSEYEYCMSLNDLFIYTLAHLTEHYIEVGSCFRPMMDLYLMHKKYESELDFEYIFREFDKLGIKAFAENIIKLYKCMFDCDGEYNESLTIMENYIVFGAPVKNASEASILARTKKKKIQRYIDALFPNIKHMSLIYPVLEKVPILLPIFWVVRFFKYFFTKRDDLKHKKQMISDVDQKSADIMREIFDKSGL